MKTISFPEYETINDNSLYIRSLNERVSFLKRSVEMQELLRLRKNFYPGFSDVFEDLRSSVFEYLYQDSQGTRPRLENLLSNLSLDEIELISDADEQMLDLLRTIYDTKARRYPGFSQLQLSKYLVNKLCFKLEKKQDRLTDPDRLRNFLNRQSQCWEHNILIKNQTVTEFESFIQKVPGPDNFIECTRLLKHFYDNYNSTVLDYIRYDDSLTKDFTEELLIDYQLHTANIEDIRSYFIHVPLKKSLG